VGVVGVAWRVQLMSCKFIDSQGNGAISDAITCIDYARKQHARIINASWGDTTFQSAALHDAIASARDAGILFVAAAGNSSGDNDANPLYPASYPLDNIIAVASTNRTDGLSFFSNYGATSVELAAPGEDIFSSWNDSDSGYQYESGTSMAAAYVSGAAAVLMAHAPGDNYAAIRQRILTGTDPLPALQGKVMTGGRLNLFNALLAGAPTTPAAPTNLAATATSSSAINLTWTDNADNEQGFRVERSADNASFTEITTLGASVTSYTDTSLAASTTYYYRVRAFNTAGNSAYSTRRAPRPSRRHRPCRPRHPGERFCDFVEQHQPDMDRQRGQRAGLPGGALGRQRELHGDHHARGRRDELHGQRLGRQHDLLLPRAGVQYRGQLGLFEHGERQDPVAATDRAGRAIRVERFCDFVEQHQPDMDRQRGQRAGLPGGALG